MAKAKRTPRKSGRRSAGGAKETTFEVQDTATAPKSSATLEDGLVWVTFVALIVGLIVSQLELSDFGQGLF